MASRLGFLVFGAIRLVSAGFLIESIGVVTGNVVCGRTDYWAKMFRRNIGDFLNSSSTLEESKWSTDRIEYFSKIYEEKKLEIEAMLSSTGSSHPHIVDVDWRLDYYIKNNHMDKVNKPTYLITLKTEESGCAAGKDVQFSCSMEQLQDLVGKLKEACKTLERTANS